MSKDAPLLETRSLTKEFRGFKAVSDVNLSVAEGTIHALVGPNGAGKTTLFNLLTGFLSPSSGSIVFDGMDITGKEPEQIAPLGIARSFQITSLFDQMTLREHLELALAGPTGMGMQFWRSIKRMAVFRDRSMELLDRVEAAYTGFCVGLRPDGTESDRDYLDEELRRLGQESLSDLSTRKKFRTNLRRRLLRAALDEVARRQLSSRATKRQIRARGDEIQRQLQRAGLLGLVGGSVPFVSA